MAKTLGQLATEVLNKKYEKPIEGIPKGDLAETYIKSTDYATAAKAGVVQIDPNYSALYQWQHPVTHNTLLMLNGANAETIKAGNSVTNPIMVGRQHEAVFYGLAKAAGDTTQSSSNNAVGTYTDAAKTAIRAMLGAISNTDYATSSTGGVIKVGTEAYGLSIDSNGQLMVAEASTTNIKEATGAYRPLTAPKIGAIAFYGLAKAAGDTTQTSSSNAVGTYTPEAKAAIHTMLDIDNSIVEQYISSTAPTITAMTNCRYICNEVTSLNFTPCVTGTCEVIFTAGSTLPVVTLPSTVKMPEWYVIETNTIYDIIITNGVYGAVMSWAL